MPITNTNPQPKDVVILQRDATNTYYGETHISASEVILHIDASGNLNADKSASFYTLYPPPATFANAAISASWASQSLSTSFFITTDNPLPVDQRTVVVDTTARDAIPLGDRYLGLRVWVTNDSKEYTLIGGTNNAFWQQTPISASFAQNSYFSVTASHALNSGGGGSNLVGSNNYVGYWWNNVIVTGSLIYVNDDNVGINTPNPIANDTFTITEVSNSNVLWTPTLLGSDSPRLWYRADAITDISASLLNLWPDSTPNLNHATASAATSRPVLVYNVLNGYPAVRFDGTNDQMRCLVPTSVSCSALTAFVVAKVTSYAPTVTNANVGTIFGNSHVGNNRDIVVGERFDGGTSRFTWTLHTEDAVSSFDTETPINPYNAKTGEWYINTVIVNGGASSTTIYLSGSASGSGVSAQSTNLDLKDLCIGWESSSNQPFNGDIAEIIIITSSISAGDQSRVEGYLAWKYGLVQSLPTAHTYKTSMPIPLGGGNIQVWKDINRNVVGFFSGSGILYATSSFAISASWAPGSAGSSTSASWASQSLSSSQAISSSYALTASSAVNAYQAVSASWAPPLPSDYAISASWASESFWASSASFASSSLFARSASWASKSFSADTASWASQSLSSSNSLTSSFALTASFATNLNPNAVSASWASQSLSSSFAITASFSLNVNPNALSASWASASFVATSASFASRSFFSTSASFASVSISASWAPPIPSDFAVSASWASESFWATTASFASKSFISVTSSFASKSFAADSASWASRSISASFAVSASWSPPQFNNFAESASWASFSLSASWAPTFGIVGTNNYLPKWQNNSLTETSSLFDVGTGVGVRATGSQIDAALTVKAFSSSSNILWSPFYATVPMRVWLRGDDITGSQSSSVSLWPDTGSYGNYFTQSTAGNQPALYTSSINGHSVVHFDGTNDRLSAISGSTSISQSSLCVFAVVKPQTFPVSPSAFSNGTVIANGHSGNSRDFTLGPRIFSGVPEWNMYNESGTTTYDINALANISRSWYIVNGNVNSNNSILTVYINNAATSSGVVNGSNDMDLRDLFVGFEPNFGQPFSGEIAEIIITNQNISSDEQRKMEGYLAWKYALTSSLPLDHQYINVAPYVLDSSTIQSWKNFTSDTVAFVSSSGLYVGTASWAYNSTSASWAPPSGVTAFSISSSWASQSLSSSYAVTASYALIAIGPGTPKYFTTWVTSGSLSDTSSLYETGSKVGLGTIAPSGSLTIFLSNTNAYTTATDHITLVNPSLTGQTHITSIISGSNSLAGRWRTDYLKQVVYVSYANAVSAGHYFLVNGDTDVGSTKAKITIGGIRIGQNVVSDAPTALLHLAGGDGTATRGQMKWDSSTLLTAPEAGVIEFNTDKWFCTINTGVARKEFAINDITMPSGSVVVTTTNGRLTVVTGSGVWNITSSYSTSASFSSNTTIIWPVPGWYQLQLSESRLGATARTASSTFYGAAGAMVSGTVYVFGGYSGAAALGTIWTSSVGDGGQITVATGKTLPIPVLQTNCIRLGNSLYLFGGAIDAVGTPTSSIQTASLEDPTTWVATGSLPFNLSNHNTVVINDNQELWIFGGLTSSGSAVFSASLYATASNPLSWSIVPVTWFGGGGYQSTIAGNAAVLGDKICAFGGFAGSGFTNVNTSVYTSSVQNPSAWGVANIGINPGCAYINNSGVVIGNYYYNFGGYNGSIISSKINRAQISNPGGYASTLFSNSFNDHSQVAIVSGSKLLLYGGFTSTGSIATNRIQSASIFDLGVQALTDETPVFQNMSWSYAANYFLPSITQSMSASWAVNSSMSLFVNINLATGSSIYYIPFVTGSGFQRLYIDSGSNLTYNPATDAITVPAVSSSLFGTASWALNTLNVLQAVSASYASFAQLAFIATSSISASWASASLFASFARSASFASQSISASWAPPVPSDFSISSSFASESFWATSASFASRSISSSFSSVALSSSYAVTASWVPIGRSVVLCSAFSPTTTGGDAAEVIVPFNPQNNTVISWSVKRLSIRAQSVESITSSINIEKSSVVGAFSASLIGSVSLPSSSYENYATGTFTTTVSGDKLRFNVTTLGTAQNWTVIAELSNA